MDLIEFLRARLDEDERIAEAATPGAWSVDSAIYAESINAAEGSVVAGGRWGGEASVFETNEDAFHIARWDPARVLAEVAAKRAILDLHLELDYGHECAGGAWFGAGETCTTVRLLAQPYADHLDYRQEWKP